MIGGRIDLRSIIGNWDEGLRMAAPIRIGTVPPSVMLSRLASYARENELAEALAELEGEAGKGGITNTDPRTGDLCRELMPRGRPQKSP